MLWYGVQYCSFFIISSCFVFAADDGIIFQEKKSSLSYKLRKEMKKERKEKRREEKEKQRQAEGKDKKNKNEGPTVSELVRKSLVTRA